MPTIQDVRQRFPQYSDLSDEQLLSGLHRKFYSDLPFEDFMGRFSAPGPDVVAPTEGGERPAIPERGFLGTIGARVGDVAGSVVSGVGGIASGLGGLAGIATGSFDNALMRAGRGIQGAGESLMSPELQEKRKALSEAMKAAEEQGLAAEASAALRTLISNPGLLASMLVEQIPQFVASGGVGRAAMIAGQAAGRTGARAAVIGAERAAAEGGARAGTAAAIGTGSGLQGGEVAGQAYQDVMGLSAQILERSPAYRDLLQTMSPEDARKSLAERAGREAGLMGGAVSAGTMAALPGAEKLMFAQNVSRRAVSRVLGTAAGEATQEAIEEGGGQFAQNVAALRADVQRDLSRGVAGAATTGAVLGGVMGAGVGAIRRPEAPTAAPPGEAPPGEAPPPAPPEAPVPPATEPPPPVVPPGGTEAVAPVPPAPPVEGAPTPAVAGEVAPPVVPEIEPVLPEAPAAPVVPPPQFVSFNVPVGTQFPVITPPGQGGQTMSVDVVPEVVDLFSLVPASGRLQNRNIDAKANELLISKISRSPDFSQLTTSQYADHGAPIVGADNIVEVGNHRIAGLKKAAQENPEGFKAYIESLQNAGYDTGGMQFPVLIRRRVSDLDENQRVRFVKAANKSASQNLGPVELAREDAEFLTPDLLAKFDGTLEGGVEAAKNRGFVNDFISAISSGMDLSDFISAKTGKLTPDGVERINRALFASAYQDQSLLEKAISGADNDLKSITGAMVNATSAMQALRRGIESGRIREEFNIIPDLIKASDRIRAGRDRGMTPAEVLQIEDMVSPITPQEAALIRLLSDEKMGKVASKAAITRRLKAFAEQAATQTNDVDLVGGEYRITPEQAITQAINPDQISLFSQAPIESASQAGPSQSTDPVGFYANAAKANVVYSNKDFALLETMNKFGNIIHFGVMPNGSATLRGGSVVDVGSYDGKFVPANILEAMKKEKANRQAYLRDQAKNNPNGPFGPGAKVAFDKNFPENLRGFAAGLVKELGLGNTRILFVDTKSAQQPDFADRNKLFGEFDVARRAPFSEGFYGVSINRPGSDFHTVVVDTSKRPSVQVETVAHEIGHVFDKAVLRNAPVEVRNEIMKEFEGWLAKNKKLPSKEYVQALRTAVVGRQISAKLNNDTALKELDDYYREFNEWFADQVARWSVTSKPAQTLLGKFFQRIANAYRKIVNALGDVGMPNQTVANFIEDHRSRELVKYDPVKTKGWEKKPKQMSFDMSAMVPSERQIAEEKAMSRLPQTISVDGVERPTTNSSGRPIHTTEEGIRNFWRWFGNSKAVDDRGRPVVMYHGTLEDFNVFKLESDKRISRAFNRFGFWFDQSPATPSYFAQGTGGNIVPSYLSVKKPLVFKSEPLFIEDRKLLNRAMREGRFGEFDKMSRNLDRADAWDILMKAAGVQFTPEGKVDWKQHNESEIERRVEAFVNEAKSEGYDGIVLEDTLADAGSRYGRPGGDIETNWVIAFDPQQIKSAIGNRGQFSQSAIEIEASRAPSSVVIEDVYAGQGVKGLPKTSIEKRMVSLINSYEDGRISDKALVNLIRSLANQSAEDRRSQREVRDFAPRQRGADIVREKILAAVRRGEIERESADFALWTLSKNPNLARDLAISIRSPKSDEGMTAGSYSPQGRMMILIKNSGDDNTAVHEILHHSERMMPESVQDGIRKEWATRLASAIKDATEQQRELLAKIPDAVAGNDAARRAIMKGFADGVLNKDDHYQLVNPSEYWAVNASRILRSRYDANSWQEKARQWLREFVEKAKSIFGIRSDAPLIRGLDSVINGTGERVSRNMISENASKFMAIQQPPGGGTPLLTPTPPPPAPPTPQPKLPLGSAADFYKAVIPELNKSSLLDRVLSVLVDKKKGESVFSAFARTSINRAAPQHNLDQMNAANGYTGRSAGQAMEIALSNTSRIEQLFTTGMGKVDPATGDIRLRSDVKPLLQIMKEAGADNEDNKKGLQVYLAALKERDLRRDGRQGFLQIPDGAVLDAIREAETNHPEWKQTAADIDKLNNALIDWSLDTGVIGADQAQKLRDVFYTPFYRVLEKNTMEEPSRSVSPKIGESFTNVASAINRELKGGESPLGDLLTNIILNADSIMKAGLKNQSMRVSAEAMEFAKLAEKNLTGKKNQNTITFKVDGKDVSYDVNDPVLFSSLAGMPRTMQSGIYNTMAKMASVFRDFVTMAPSFIMSNLYKGKITAYVQEGQPFYTNTIAGVKDFLNSSTTIQNFQLQTGFGGMEYGMEPRNMVKAFERKLTDKGIMNALAKGKVLSAMRQSFGKMQRLSEATEMAERIKLAENLIKKGMEPRDAYFQAYLLAPYSRRGTGEGWVGSTLQFLMPLVPFLNAKLQTTYRLVENEKGDKKKLWTLGLPQQIFLRGLVVTAFSLLAYGLALADDEEKWDKIPPYMKLNYDIIPFMGNYITLPRAFEIGQVFGALPVFILDAVRRGEGKDLAEALVEVGKNTFFMNPMPKAVDPLISAVTNYDFFRMRPLETKGEQALPIAERVNRSTTKTGEALSATVNAVFGNVLSPIRAQALLDGYTGTMGVTLMNGFDSILAMLGAIPGKPAGAFGDPATMPAALANAAGFNRFYREDEAMVSRFVGDFYKIKEMTDQLVRSQNLARQNGDFARLQELRGEEGLPLRMKEIVNNASTQIADLNKRIRIIEKRDIDGVAKAEAIRPLMAQRDRIAKRVVDRARDIGAL